ncbi:hypothetical protein DBR45_42495, partial [Pseudomonas sp. HMWF031]
MPDLKTSKKVNLNRQGRLNTRANPFGIVMQEDRNDPVASKRWWLVEHLREQASSHSENEDNYAFFGRHRSTMEAGLLA